MDIKNYDETTQPTHQNITGMVTSWNNKIAISSSTFTHHLKKIYITHSFNDRIDIAIGFSMNKIDISPKQWTKTIQSIKAVLSIQQHIHYSQTNT